MEVAIAIIAKVGEYIVKPTINQVHYVFCFNNIVEDLKEEETNLKFAKGDVEQYVETAERSTKKTKVNVSKWLKDVDTVLEDVEMLKEQSDLHKNCLNGSCPNWAQRYHLGRKIMKKTSIMLKLQEYSNQFDDHVAHPVALPGIEFLTPKNFDVFESSKIAFDHIIEALKNDKTHIIGLYGMGGAGKTTLAKAVGKKVEEEEIFDEVVMVVVSQTPNFINIQGDLAVSLGVQLEEGGEVERAKRLYLRFTQRESKIKKQAKKKILIILDDVWESFNLKIKLGIPYEDDDKDCKILLTTRREEICTRMDCQPKIQLNVLKEDEGLALLKRHACIGDDFSELHDVARQVANECDGLPLALVAIGCALKEKDINEWKLMFQKLKKSRLEDIPNDEISGDKGIYACLKLSYDYLKGENSKLCFLLCSLYPEDYRIPEEELVTYAMGLGWYQDADSIEEERIELLSTLHYLKASALILGAGQGFVKMHDLVRDVGLWIASKGKNVFMSKVGMQSKEWSKEKNWEQYTAISSLANKIDELPIGLVCPKLEILLLGGIGYKKMLNVSDKCFVEMKALKVVRLNNVDLSLKSLRFLTNLKTLVMKTCNMRDITFFGKLNGLEILSLEESSFDDFPKELEELRELRFLDLRECYVLGNRMVEGTSVVRYSTRLFKLNSLSYLGMLFLDIKIESLPKDYVFPELPRYVIRLNTGNYCESYTSALKITNTNVTSLFAFKALYETLEYLYLETVIDLQNIVPSIDQGGLNELKSLELRNCNELEYVLGMKRPQQVLANAFSKLVELSLQNLIHLREVCCGSMHHINFQSLTELYIDSCRRLEYVFPISIARGLVQLERLTIKNAPQLVQIFYMDCRREKDEAMDDAEDIVLPKLRKIILDGLENLRFDPNYSSIWSTQKVLKISHCSSSTTSFFARVKMQDLKKKLQLPSREGYCHQLRDRILIGLRGDLKNLEKLSIKNCGIKVVFQLEGLETTTDEQNELSFPSLKQLMLQSLEELEGLCKGPSHTLSLQNLMKLYVSNCSKLKHLFSRALFPNLLSLKELYVWDCGELEQIVVECDEEGKTLLNHHVRPQSFPNLSLICVKWCGKLKCLFPITMAQGLQQLHHVEIIGNFELEEVFGHKGRADPMDNKEISLPQLHHLTLVELPSFTNFCPIGYHFTFASLAELAVEKCPKIATIFSFTQDESVHVEARAPKIRMEDERGGLPLEPTMVIDCSNSDQLRERLPPYLKN